MKNALVVLLLSVAASCASAALPAGASAPDFSLEGAFGGKPMNFSLRQTLKTGPVVLYFFPAAFTEGCTRETLAFADATDTFKHYGASIIGVTAGNVDRVAEFSQLVGQDKFPMAADPGAKVAALYQTVRSPSNTPLSERTSYVIAPDGRILLSYTDANFEHHVEKTLAAVKKWQAQHP